MFIRKFSSLDFSVKVKLFNSFCMNFYGLEIFMNKKHCSDLLRQLGVAYHYALKKLLGFPKYYSNHYTCYLLDDLVFTHFMNYRRCRFLFWLKDTISPCFYRHKTFFMRFSHFNKFITEIFNTTYGVCNLLDNELQVLYSRIMFVQVREPTSWRN